MDIAYLNGTFLPLAKAKISVLDRGFLFAESVYEVIPVYAGSAFLCDEHLARLSHSLSGIDLNLDKSHDAIKIIIDKVLKKNQALTGNCLIYLQVTRGAEPTRKHIYADYAKPSLFVTLLPFPKNHSTKGVKVITKQDRRGEQSDIKDNAKLYHTMDLKQATKQGASEVIYIRQNRVTEAASSNVFAVKNGVVYTPPKSSAILTGITRNKIISLLKENHVAINETDFTRDELLCMDEVWLSASSKEVIPISTIDNKTFPILTPSLYNKIKQWYQQAATKCYVHTSND